MSIPIPQDKMTPLIMAASRGYIEVVELLLEAGADHHAELPKKYYSVSESTAYLRTRNPEIKARYFQRNSSPPSKFRNTDSNANASTNTRTVDKIRKLSHNPPIGDNRPQKMIESAGPAVERRDKFLRTKVCIYIHDIYICTR